MIAPAAYAVDRRRFIGGSDIAAILGVSPWKTPLQLYEQKIAEARAPEIDAPVLRRGKRWEPIAREMLIDELRGAGHDVELVKFSTPEAPNYYVDPEHPFLAAEIDAEIMLDGEHVNVEIKTVHAFKAKEWGEADTEEVPIHYASQAMFGLSVANRRRCVVGALFGADAMVPYYVLRDDETIAAIREKAVRFWFDHIVARVPPEPSNMDDIMRLFAKSNGRPVEVDEAIMPTLERLRAIRGAMSAMEREKEEAEFEIAAYVCKQWGVAEEKASAAGVDNAVLTVGGIPFASWKKQARTSLDTKRLQAAHPDICKQFSRESWFRVLRFSKS